MNSKGNTYVHDALNLKLLTKIQRKPSLSSECLREIAQ